MKKEIAILWERDDSEGLISVNNGKLDEISAVNPCDVKGERFKFFEQNENRLNVTVSADIAGRGAKSPLVMVDSAINPFSFFATDVSSETPIYIPKYNVVVTECSDKRSYKEIVDFITNKKLLTNIQKMDIEEEESYENSIKYTRDLICPFWLGLSRDIRIFNSTLRRDRDTWDSIWPMYYAQGLKLSDISEEQIHYIFYFGKGIGCTQDIKRWNEDGILPIMRAEINDEEILYDITQFASLEKSNLTKDTLRGTHYLVADAYSAGGALTEEQNKAKNEIVHDEINRDEETVLYCRIKAKNTTAVPRYAWFKIPTPVTGYQSTAKHHIEDSTGFGVFDIDNKNIVYSINKINNMPVIENEFSVLVPPGECAVMEFIIPHKPVDRERAEKLATHDFDIRLEECKDFWKSKFDDAASIKVPEKRVEEMLNAGLLHLDLISFGLEPDGPIAPTIGTYPPIGSESAPIVQYMDSVGLHKEARRMLEYFLAKQHDDGFMQNFGGYMLETGAILWTIGEHFRYTRDVEWIKSIKDKLILSCNYILDWRNRNMDEKLKGKGYGMLNGKVADPEDDFHIFMLNGYAYVGLKRVAEVLEEVAPQEAARWSNEAEALKKDIIDSMEESLKVSPVVPLRDGTWCPTLAPWPEYIGPVSLFAEGGEWMSHGTFFTRDCLLGPIYLIFNEVIEANSMVADFLTNYNSDMMFYRNVNTSQPYYSRHPWVHLKRGEVTAFLKAYYNGFSGLADRETYAFWEHYMGGSPHKTHEEGWFLMETRYMLYLEDNDSIDILAGIPRAWLENNNIIELKNVATYFGKMNLSVKSEVNKGIITAEVEFTSQRKPNTVNLRIPHPQGIKAKSISNGLYDKQKEIVSIKDFNGHAKIVLKY